VRETAKRPGQRATNEFLLVHPLLRFVSIWLLFSLVLAGVAAVVDSLHQINLVDAAVGIVASVFAVMLLVNSVPDPVIPIPSSPEDSTGESWTRAVVHLVLLREMVQRTLAYPGSGDSALRDLLTDLVAFRRSRGGVVTRSDRNAGGAKELSPATRSFLDGAALASAQSLRSVVDEVQAL
jgi:hypothetical protein